MTTRTHAAPDARAAFVTLAGVAGFALALAAALAPRRASPLA
ncbi:MAG TPA: hypothetical protein VFZ11_14280 [Gemmatimonadaceae bacterium]